MSLSPSRIAPPLLLVSLLSACGGGGGAAVPTGGGSATLTLLHAAPNPTGLATGFYEVRGAQATTLGVMGHRPVARAGFDGWASLETSPGVYAFPDISRLQRSHVFGERLQAAVNVSFSNAIVPGQGTIPAFYADDITDPATRAAAKRFLRAYVQWLLRGAGSLVLTIDYEIVGNWRLDVDDAARDARAAAWGAWYVEAAAVARQAAADLGQSADLTLQPIVNTDPLAAGNPMGLGAVARNQWLVDAVKASDALALDTYWSDMSAPPADPTHTLDIIRFWIDAFSAGKPVVVAENGFSSVTTVDPNITRAQHQGKLTGTEAQQASYFAALFPRLQQMNAPGGPFHNQLRAYDIWSIVDNPYATDEASIYYGLVRQDGSLKPAAPVVRDAIASIESDPVSRPWAWADAGTDVTAGNQAGTPLSFADGERFDVLRVSVPSLPAGPGCHVTGTASQPGSLLVDIAGGWTQADLAGGPFRVDLPLAACRTGAPAVADLLAPGPRFPASQVLAGVALGTD